MGSGEWGQGEGETRGQGEGRVRNVKRRGAEQIVPLSPPLLVPLSPPLPTLLFLEDHCVFPLFAAIILRDYLRHRFAVGRESDLAFEEVAFRTPIDHQRVAFPFGAGLRR